MEWQANQMHLYAQNKVILYYCKSAGCAQKNYDGRKSPANY